MLRHDKDAGRVARVTKRLYGAPDGVSYPRWFDVGAFIRGDLAEAEVAAKRAEWVDVLETKAPEVARGPFQTGAGEPSSSQPAGRAKGKRTSRKRAEKPSSS